MDRALLNGALPPRGGCLEALVIDDHIGIAVDAPGSSTHRDALIARFDRASAGNRKVNLALADHKARRAVT